MDMLHARGLIRLIDPMPDRADLWLRRDRSVQTTPSGSIPRHQPKPHAQMVRHEHVRKPQRKARYRAQHH